MHTLACVFLVLFFVSHFILFLSKIPRVNSSQMQNKSKNLSFCEKFVRYVVASAPSFMHKDMSDVWAIKIVPFILD